MTPPRPFKIQIFVAEGAPDGLRFVEKSNWVGLGIVCPRSRFPEARRRDEFKQSGVYLLLGRDDSQDRPKIYIGEGETILHRLDEHQVKKDFWTEAIVFTQKGDPLHKAQVQHLEARLCQLASERKRCTLANKNKPILPGLSEADKAEIEGYLDEMLSLLPVLGIDAFEEVKSASEETLILNLSGPGCEAQGYESNGGFTARKGSRARPDTVPSLETHCAGDYKKRNTLIEEDVLLTDQGSLLLQMDYEFTSPSQASTVMLGRSSNGRVDWKDSDGVSLKEHQERAASASPMTH